MLCLLYYLKAFKYLSYLVVDLICCNCCRIQHWELPVFSGRKYLLGHVPLCQESTCARNWPRTGDLGAPISSRMPGRSCSAIVLSCSAQSVVKLSTFFTQVPPSCNWIVVNSVFHRSHSHFLSLSEALHRNKHAQLQREREKKSDSGERDKKAKKVCR